MARLTMVWFKCDALVGIGVGGHMERCDAMVEKMCELVGDGHGHCSIYSWDLPEGWTRASWTTILCPKHKEIET